MVVKSEFGIASVSYTNLIMITNTQMRIRITCNCIRRCPITITILCIVIEKCCSRCLTCTISRLWLGCYVLTESGSWRAVQYAIPVKSEGDNTAYYCLS